MKALLETLLQQKDLTRDEAASGVEAIIQGADPCQAAAFLVLLKAKGETSQEVAGMVSTLRKHWLPVNPGVPCVDIVGTGGDGHHTVNFSTAASLVAAACGASVAKHGNRSVSSMCGSADVLETLGIDLSLPAAGVERCIREAGIAFMFAPNYHPAFKNIVPIRKALGVRTVFNILGPLLNPASCPYLLIGVYNEALVPLMGEALHSLGVEMAMVVHCGGLDELAPVAVATVATVRKATGVEMGTLDPFALGFAKCTLDDLKGGTAAENAEILRQVLGGKLPGPVTDTVVLNAAAGLYVSGRAGSVAEGCTMARAASAPPKPPPSSTRARTAPRPASLSHRPRSTPPSLLTALHSPLTAMASCARSRGGNAARDARQVGRRMQAALTAQGRQGERAGGRGRPRSHAPSAAPRCLSLGLHEAALALGVLWRRA